MNKPKTQLMSNPMIESTVESVIATLKHINVDGETMEYILKQVEYLVEEKKDLDNQK
jgi:hypothetical protein